MLHYDHTLTKSDGTSRVAETGSSGLVLEIRADIRCFFSVLLIVSLLFGPLTPVFAQEAGQPVVGSDATTAASTEGVSPATAGTESAPTTDLSPTSEPGTSNLEPTVESEASLSEDPASPPAEKAEDAKGDEKPKEDEDGEGESAMAGVTGPDGANTQSVVLGSFGQDRVKMDKNTGAMEVAFPIVIPPGRNGIQPNLNLIYSSQDSEEGNIFGEGWSISIPYIERLNKTGVEDYYGGSSQFLFSSFDGELATTSVASTYTARTENGAFNKYVFSNDSWVMTDKHGTRYTFGSSTDALQNNPSSTGKIYRWMLREVKDTNNNFVTYSYFKDAGQIYPSSTTYTSNTSTVGIFRVDFLRESRSDKAVSARAGFLVQSNYRVSEIDAYVSSTLVRKYELDYQAGDNGVTSLLGSITETGFDGSGNSVALPPVAFTYKKQTAGWTSNAAWIPPVDFISGSGADNGLRIADVSGDGLPDIVQAYIDESGIPHYLSFVNNGAGWTVTSTWSPSTAFTHNGADRGLRLVDVNGDGLADLIRAHRNSGGATFYESYLNNGAGWTTTSTWNPTVLFVDYDADSGVRIADVNGDGLPDLLSSSGAELNNGNGWTGTSTWSLPIPFVVNGVDQGTRLADVNGDGLPDVLATSTSYLNNGAGWTATSTWVSPVAFYSTSTGDTGLRIADVNGDGLSDLVRAYRSGGADNFAAYINNGAGWTSTSTWNSPLTFVTDGDDNGGRIVDVNGDGLPDVLASSTSHLNNNTIRADILTGATYAQGGSSAISYRSATEYTDDIGNVLTTVPYPVYVVSQTAHNDGTQTASTLTYEYSGGFYYVSGPFDHQFAGFDEVTETDAAGTVTKTFYHAGNESDTARGEYQDNFWKISKPYRVETYNAAESLYRKVVSKWDHAALGGLAGFVKLAQTVQADYDGLATHSDKAESYAFDNTNGNQTQRIEWGRVSSSDDGTFTDTSTDKLTMSISYATSSLGFSGKQSNVIVTNQSSTKIKESRFYYDGQSLGSATLGNLTKEERWVSSTTYIDIENTYNGYGLVTQNLDPRDKQTNYAYDAYHLYPATTTNALGHATRYEYDYASGKKTKVIDPNGNAFRTVYDGLNRPLSVLQPDPAATSTLVTSTVYVYTDTANAVRVRESVYLDASTAVETYRYFDGLGRLVQTRKSAEDAGTYKVSDRVYNNVGLLQKESLPYFGSGASSTAPTNTVALYSTYTYDALGKVLTAETAVGTVTNAYANWKTTVTDPHGNPKDEYADAYGNLVQVDEHNGTSTYSTFYTYDGLRNLTKITDALVNVRTFTYDGLSRRLSAQDLHAAADATFGTWTYSYDNAGNLTQSVDPKSQTVSRTYDDLNRILTENFTGATGTEMTYTYDTCSQGVGRPCIASSSDVVTSMAYDALGRTVTEAKTISSTAYTTSYTYDWQGNQLVITNPDASQIKYTYNGAGLAETVEEKEDGEGSFTTVIADLDYALTDKVAWIEYANGMTTKNVYDHNQLYRLVSKITTNVEGEEMMFGGGESMQSLMGPLPNEPRELYYTPLYDSSSLVSYYRLEANGNDSKDGNNVNCTVTWPTAVFGQGASFSGASGNYCPSGSSPSNLNFNRYDPFSVSLWAQFTTTANVVLVGKVNANLINYVHGWMLMASNGSVYFHLGSNNGTELKAHAEGEVNDGVWHLITVTYDGSGSAGGIKFYVDGNPPGTAIDINNLNTSTTSTNKFSIGGIDNGGSGVNLFSGAIDDLAIFSRVLTEEEALDLYLGNWEASVPKPTSLGQFKLDGSTAINRGSSTDETGVTFKATLNSTGTLNLKLQIEAQPMGKNFANIATSESSFVASGSVATATFYGDIGGHHWQARTVDAEDNVSPWVRFSTSTFTTDFIIGPDTFDYTGSVASYTVPIGVNQLVVTAYGAQGGSADGTGGLGGKTSGVISVTPGATYYVNVGGVGKEGQIESGCLTGAGGGGGGLTWISKQSSFSQSSALLVAAGGGGGGGDHAGSGSNCTTAGGAGGYGGGGVGGTTFSGQPTHPGTGGGGGGYLGGFGATCNPGAGASSTGYAAGQGGSGTNQSGCGPNQGSHGGAGGGVAGSDGYRGSPDAAGGGGGSSFVSSTLTSTSTQSGVNSGNGYLVIQAIAAPVVSLASLNQYRASGTIPILEGETTNEGSVVFKATLNSDATSSVQLQIEARSPGASFTNTPNVTSSAFVSPGSTATTTLWGKTGAYRWQARVVDTQSNSSSWQIFGADTSTNSADFIFSRVVFTHPTLGTTTPQFPNWLLNARYVTSSNSYTLRVNWGLTAPNQVTSSINTSGTQLLSGVSVPKTLFSGDYTDTGETVAMLALASLYDITGGGNTLVATSSVSFNIETIPAPETCDSLEIQCISYTYDANGNITRIVDTSQSATSKTVDYVYDDLNRLVSASSSNVGSGSNYLHTFTYNAIGNILTKSDQAGTYRYEGNQSSSYANPHAVTAIGTGTSTVFAYDNTGNLTSHGTTTYSYNYRNQLTQAANGNGTSTYTYDHAGGRALMKVGSAVTHYPTKGYTVTDGVVTKHIFLPDGTLVALIELAEEEEEMMMFGGGEEEFLSESLSKPVAANIPAESEAHFVGSFTEKSDTYDYTLSYDAPNVVGSNVLLMKNAPEIRLRKWGGEVNLGLTYGDLKPSGPAARSGNHVVWNGGTTELRAYPLPVQRDMENGGFEIELHLKEKPTRNVFEFTVNGAENLDFFYQSPLDEEEERDEEAAECTKTRCLDAKGNVVAERPEHIVGSYAVYVKDGKSGDLTRFGGKDYGTGKAFHIYRPRITDDAANWTWGELSFDSKKNTLSVTVPRKFLDSAKYPVVVDPTFGYTSVGASSANTSNAAGSKYAISASGTVTQISVYTKAASGNVDVGAALYSDNSGAPDDLLTSHTSAPSQGTTASWVDVPVTSYAAASGTTYWIWGWASGSHTIYWDSGSTNQYNVQGLTWPTWTNPITPGTYFARKLSVYATYSASSSNSAPTAPTSLLTEGQTNPTNATDTTPEFSAIYNDPDGGDQANKYVLQVSTSSSFTSTYWNSGTSTMATTTAGNRSPDISYAGSALATSTTYYWRVRFVDVAGLAGAWSTATSTFVIVSGNTAPTAPTSLLTEGQTNPTNIADATPELSAIYNDPDGGDQANKYHIQVSTSSSFTSTYWNSATTTMATTTAGNRSPDISYAGPALSSGVTYYWRIQFVDVGGLTGAWSTSTATFSIAGGSSQEHWIYNDSTNWDDWSWSVTKTWQSAEQVYDGTYAIKAIYTSAWGGLFLNASTAVAISPYENLRFAVRYDGTGGSLAGSQVVVKLYDPSNQPTGQQALTNYVSGGSLASDTWYDVTIPLIDLGASTSSIKGFSIQNGSTTTLFVDVVRFASDEVPLTPAIRYVLTDHLGGTNLVTDTNGTILQELDYYPFGEQRISSGEATDRGYIGERFDPATNLNYLNARYYDSARGQFTSQDPVFWEVGLTQDGRLVLTDPQLHNSYSYAASNPLRFKDPEGRFIPQAIVLGALYGGAAGFAGQMYSDYQSGSMSSVGTYFNSIGKGGTVGVAGVYGAIPAAVAALGYSLTSNYFTTGITAENATEAVGESVVTGLTAGFLKGLPAVSGPQAVKILGGRYVTGAHGVRYAQEALFGLGTEIYYNNIKGSTVNVMSNDYNQAPIQTPARSGSQGYSSGGSGGGGLSGLVQQLQSLVSALQRLVSSLKSGK